MRATSADSSLGLHFSVQELGKKNIYVSETVFSGWFVFFVLVSSASHLLGTCFGKRGRLRSSLHQNWKSAEAKRASLNETLQRIACHVDLTARFVGPKALTHHGDDFKLEKR
jgi:hypothetical protein